MSQMILTFALDVVMASLLVVTIVYCVKLNRRIKVLQDSKGELAQLIQQFDETTERAGGSINELQGVARKVTEHMKHKIDRANYLADDLAFMIERGNKLADKMEDGLSSGRKVRAKPEGKAEGTSSLRGAGNAQSERSKPEEPQTASRDGGEHRKSSAALESMLGRMGSRKGKRVSAVDGDEVGEVTPKKAPRPGAKVRMRSKAEQELFDALKSGS